LFVWQQWNLAENLLKYSRRLQREAMPIGSWQKNLRNRRISVLGPLKVPDPSTGSLLESLES
jgi:hypothetical protein